MDRKYKNYTARWEFQSLSDTDSEDEDVEDFVMNVDFYKDDKKLYTLPMNTYHTDYQDFLLLEYFEIDGQVVHLFNLEHSMISIINADTGKEIHCDSLFDMFISDYKLFDNREYMYVAGFIWSPLPARVIYHIPTFLKTPNYKPITIPCWEYDPYKSESRTAKIDLYGYETVKEFLANKDEIAHNIFVKCSNDLFNENRNKETLLKVFLKEPSIYFIGDSKNKLQKLLDTTQEKFYIKTYGLKSNSRLNRFDRILYTKIEYDESVINSNDVEITGRSQNPSKLDNITFLCSKMLCSNYLADIPCESYNMRFEVYGSCRLTIEYNQELTWDVKDTTSYDPFGTKRCMVDKSKPCRIIVK